MAEKATHLLLLDLFCSYSLFILFLTIEKNRKVLEYPLNFFLTCRSLPIYEEATASGSCLSCIPRNICMTSIVIQFHAFCFYSLTVSIADKLLNGFG